MITQDEVRGEVGRPRRASRADVVAVLGEAQAQAAWAAALVADVDAARSGVVSAFEAMRARRAEADLARVPVDRVRDVTEGRLSLDGLAAHGVRTIADVLRAGTHGLQAAPGIGPQTAARVVAAAEQIERAARESVQLRIEVDPSDRLATELLQAVRTWESVVADDETLVPQLRRFVGDVALATLAAAPAAAHPLRRLFIAGARKAAADEAVGHLTDLVRWARSADLAAAATRVAQTVRHVVPAPAAWADFERRSATYYALLAPLVDLREDVAAATGFLPSEIVERIEAQHLDESLLRASLRGYQAFGARFALVQRRVIVGDEMGLGKTVQAIAAMAHLVAGGATHVLVVAPASVLHSWVREIATHSALTALLLHGEQRDEAAAHWAARGGVAVTTFSTLRRLALDDVSPAMLVVDEAHFVKNPDAKRSRAVARVAQRSERVLFLTGTPMEHTVDEFCSLVRHLRPDLADTIDPGAGAAGADAFRSAVAPVYLRRNLDDVLTELPPLVQVDEWEEFGAVDGAAYRAAVEAGSFPAMRRAAFASGDPHESAKLERLLEICAEAGANGDKVMVFSWFREVLDVVHAALSPTTRTFGPLTGSTSAAGRQRLVDEFTAAPGGAVLVAQVRAGGVGLNIQAASVVVLCEPQVSPALEAQAIARTHRMGQVRTVRVHRLVVEDSVDQRLLETLETKRGVFDAYVRESALTEAAAAAVDVSAPHLARAVVAEEQTRLATR
ncbi:DEAD/DEAH box helicase [Cellulomonas persica]|uniref:Helicase SNF2 n=1 Tax=Cellulomonas persica TaxID=76861 RepID=A0A510UUK6_9CELL|nr:SNF2-related protein [Cellulomonas persica]GEK18176.1 helicase SNF2 [Cellulomonas persica]